MMKSHANKGATENAIVVSSKSKYNSSTDCSDYA